MATHEILALDVAGTPVRWIDFETAAGYYATNKVRWELGEQRTVLHGGMNRGSGRQSTLELATIIAVDGPRFKLRYCGRPGAAVAGHALLPRPARLRLLRRQFRRVAAGDGARDPALAGRLVDLAESRLGLPALQPAQGQPHARKPRACRCLYVPYVPNRHEAFILANRRILSDQMSFLLAGVPRHSRLFIAGCIRASERGDRTS